MTAYCRWCALDQQPFDPANYSGRRASVKRAAAIVPEGGSARTRNSLLSGFALAGFRHMFVDDHLHLLGPVTNGGTSATFSAQQVFLLSAGPVSPYGIQSGGLTGDVGAPSGSFRHRICDPFGGTIEAEVSGPSLKAWSKGMGVMDRSKSGWQRASDMMKAVDRGSILIEMER